MYDPARVPWTKTHERVKPRICEPGRLFRIHLFGLEKSIPHSLLLLGVVFFFLLFAVFLVFFVDFFFDFFLI